MPRSPRLQRQFDAALGALAENTSAFALDKCRTPRSAEELAFLAPRVEGAKPWTRDKAAKQLSQLRRAGLATSKRSGSIVRYRSAPAPFIALADWAEELGRPGVAPASSTERRLKRGIAAALANPGRRALFEAVAQAGGRTQAELVRACGLPQVRASRGLKTLVAAELVRTRPLGRAVVYEVDPQGFGVLAWWLRRIAEGLAPAAPSTEGAPVRVRRSADTALRPIDEPPSAAPEVRPEGSASSGGD